MLYKSAGTSTAPPQLSTEDPRPRRTACIADIRRSSGRVVERCVPRPRSATATAAKSHRASRIGFAPALRSGRGKASRPAQRVLPRASAGAFIVAHAIRIAGGGALLEAPAPAIISQNRNRGRSMPDLGALLWPRTVALIGASADAESLRGRIFNVMRGHAFAGQLYPVSRSSAEVLGPEGLPQRRRPAAAGRPRRHHHPRQARGGGTGALRQGRRALGGGAEQRLCRGDRRTRAGRCRPRCAPSPSATTWR